eukprot:CAMPEP_0178383366 /NCGR_PEP_ID=MMETSP0689_2-20121128/6965_1 /TAXON_ID=160604 /ORGANISM="Amphidinium massartii, Strain CS-259" /LENGTH=284 /DNA_ID=CAMNT_0020003585 /DNA_START=40 /DNA_END=891 /DNA_ORIENTATION=-
MAPSSEGSLIPTGSSLVSYGGMPPGSVAMTMPPPSAVPMSMPPMPMPMSMGAVPMTALPPPGPYGAAAPPMTQFPPSMPGPMAAPKVPVPAPAGCSRPIPPAGMPPLDWPHPAWPHAELPPTGWNPPGVGVRGFGPNPVGFGPNVPPEGRIHQAPGPGNIAAACAQMAREDQELQSRNQRWLQEVDASQWQWFGQEHRAQWQWKAEEERRSADYVQQWAGRRSNEIDMERQQLFAQKAMEAQLRRGPIEEPPRPATLWMQAQPEHYCGDDWHTKQYLDPMHYKS